MSGRLFIPAGRAAAELSVKNSRFIGSAEAAESPARARELAAEIRSRHPGARHVVHAFICGPAGEVMGQSDDGEPHGTAGRPALEVLKGRDLTDTVLVIVRYFGGTKLGTGGLVRAYAETARMVLDLLPVELYSRRIECAAKIPYPIYDRVRTILEEVGCRFLEESFEEDITLLCAIPEETLCDVNERLSTCSAGTVKLSPSERNGSCSRKGHGL